MAPATSSLLGVAGDSAQMAFNKTILSVSIATSLIIAILLCACCKKQKSRTVGPNGNLQVAVLDRSEHSLKSVKSSTPTPTPTPSSECEEAGGFLKPEFMEKEPPTWRNDAASEYHMRTFPPGDVSPKPETRAIVKNQAISAESPNESPAKRLSSRMQLERTPVIKKSHVSRQTKEQPSTIGQPLSRRSTPGHRKIPKIPLTPAISTASIVTTKGRVDETMKSAKIAPSEKPPLEPPPLIYPSVSVPSVSVEPPTLTTLPQTSELTDAKTHFGFDLSPPAQRAYVDDEKPVELERKSLITKRDGESKESGKRTAGATAGPNSESFTPKTVSISSVSERSTLKSVTARPAKPW